MSLVHTPMLMTKSPMGVNMQIYPSKKPTLNTRARRTNISIDIMKSNVEAIRNLQPHLKLGQHTHNSPVRISSTPAHDHIVEKCLATQREAGIDNYIQERHEDDQERWYATEPPYNDEEDHINNNAQYHCMPSYQEDFRYIDNNTHATHVDVDLEVERDRY